MGATRVEGEGDRIERVDATSAKEGEERVEERMLHAKWSRQAQFQIHPCDDRTHWYKRGGQRELDSRAKAVVHPTEASMFQPSVPMLPANLSSQTRAG